MSKLGELLKKAQHELVTTNGLYCTDIEMEAGRMKDSCKWQLDNTELIHEIDELLNQKTAIDEVYLEEVENQIKPGNILKTVYNYANIIQERENELLKLKYNIEYRNKAIQEATDKILADKDLMQKWKEEYNITNNQGRMLKINEDFKDEKEAIKQEEHNVKKLNVELSFCKKLYNLHVLVFEKLESVKLDNIIGE